MGKALSLDLRRRVASSEVSRFVLLRPGSRCQLRVRFGQKLRAGGDLTPAKRGGSRPSPITAAVGNWLRTKLAEKPDLTMRSLAAELGQRGTSVTHDTVWRFVHRQSLTVKQRP